MKNSHLFKLIIISCLFFSQTSLFCQQDAHHTGFSSYEATYDNFAREFGNFVHEKMAIRRLNVKDIKGSPYLNAEFTLGTVYTLKNVHYTDIPLRYNIYNDVIEFKLRNDSVYAISNPEIIRQIEIEGETFFYHQTAYNKAGYYCLKYDGEVQLLYKYNIAFQDEAPTAAFAEGIPASFQAKAKTFFIKMNDELPISISRKKDLKHIFGDKNSQMLSFIKRENLNIRKEEDLVKLVEFINQSM